MVSMVMIVCECVPSHLSRVWFFETLPGSSVRLLLPIGFPRQEYWSELSFPWSFQRRGQTHISWIGMRFLPLSHLGRPWPWSLADNFHKNRIESTTGSYLRNHKEKFSETKGDCIFKLKSLKSTKRMKKDIVSWPFRIKKGKIATPL